jgi:hypothetical protein
MMIETEMLRLEITYNYDVTKNDVFGSVAIGNCQTRFDMSHGFTRIACLCLCGGFAW